MAQKRTRPAYCFQHLDLELRSHDDGAPAGVAAVSAMFALRPHVVACFAPEWNSLDRNKTRFFNLLEALVSRGIGVHWPFSPGRQGPPIPAGLSDSDVSGSLRLAEQPKRHARSEFRPLWRYRKAPNGAATIPPGNRPNTAPA